MEKYAWTEKYSVDVKEIDKQHEHYFEIVNEIVRMTGEEKISAKELLVKINDLANYASYHFMTEENFFSHYGYPDAGAHMEAHDSYREKIRDFIAKAENSNADIKKIVFEISEFAGSWLINHIMIMDQKYISFMHSNGIS